MKYALMTVLLCLWALATYSQTDTELVGSNSFDGYYAKKSIKIKYYYIESTQTHDYSGNWDFDGDGKKDGLFFIGNGGAHLYYHLEVVLSSDHRSRDFVAFIEIDFPVVSNVSQLKTKDKQSIFPQFVVSDFDSDGRDEIYININNNYTSIPPSWKRKGVTSKCLLLDYKDKDLRITNYKF